MAYSHKAYSFNSQSFNQLLIERIVVNNEVQTELLYKLALERLDNPSQNMIVALDEFRYGEDWIDRSEEDVSLVFQWFLIVLASVLSTLPSLSNRLISGHSLLESSLLNTESWQQSDVKMLLVGNQDYKLLLSDPWNKILGVGIGLFSTNFRGMGWLSNSQALILLNKLLLTEDKFDSSATKAVVEKSEEMNLPVSHDEIREIYNDAVLMLQTAIERNHDLFFVRSA